MFSDLMRRLLVAALAFAPFVLSLPAMAQAPDFDGITIIAIDDDNGEDVIRGRQDSPVDTGKYLVVFVAGRGSYAAMRGRAGGTRSCIAWAVPGSYTGSSITFGLPASKITLRSAHPQICQPFKLTYVDAETVRIEADNPYDASGGPLSPDARIKHYSRERRVVAHTPLIDFDWGASVFDRFRIKGVSLGPLLLSKATLTDQVRTSISKFRAQPAPRKSFEARFPQKDAAGRSSVSVHGYLAARELLHWPWDVLYGLSFSEYLPETTTDAFLRAVEDRYGPPSMQLPSPTTGRVQLYWFEDLANNQIGKDSPGAANCLAPDLAAIWQGRTGLPDLSGDLGPWGCSVIFMVQHDGLGGTVSQYRMEAISGYVMALNHFFGRLGELDAARARMAKDENAKPKL